MELCFHIYAGGDNPISNANYIKMPVMVMDPGESIHFKWLPDKVQ